MNYLLEYSNFSSVKEMDKHVSAHKYYNFDKLTKSACEVLYCIAAHSLKYVGASHLKISTIVKETGLSESTVKRSTKKLCELNIIKKQNKPKNNGIKGANVYSILFCGFLNDLSSDLSEVTYREKPDEPTESKRQEPKKETESLISLSTNKSLKYTNTTEVSDKLRLGLLEKLPKCIKQSLESFVMDVEELYTIAGTIFKAKSKIDNSIRLEDHEELYYNCILSVMNSKKYASYTGKEFNVNAVIYKAILDLTKSILNGTAYDKKEKIKYNPKFNNKTVEVIPDWFNDYKKENVKEEIVLEVTESELEERKRKVLERIQNLGK